MGVILGLAGPTLVVVGIAFGVVLLALWLLFREAQRRSRRPFSGRPLRPPGESLRIKIERLNDTMLLQLMVLAVVVFPMATLSDAGFKRDDLNVVLVSCLVGLALMLGIVLWVWQTVKRLRDYKLGFDGERAVGEELNRLMLDGCQVFHDLQMDGVGNIDHVVVAPHAVFAVETKAKRKQRQKKAATEQESHKAIFTGDELVYPFGTDRGDLDQVRRNARALAEKLGRLTKQPVTVKSVLVLPGWYIERTGKSEVAVVNDKPSQLRPAMVDRRAAPLDGKLRDQICAQLEDWSRGSMKR